LSFTTAAAAAAAASSSYSLLNTTKKVAFREVLPLYMMNMQQNQHELLGASGPFA